VVKEKILELEHTNSVSMPSAVFLEAGTDSVLRVARAGSVKLRRELLGLRADGACSGCACWDGAGIVIVGVLYGHCSAGGEGAKVAWRRRRPALVEACITAVTFELGG
jgi:hypothetical protein